jgi:hypothetical protein
MKTSTGKDRRLSFLRLDHGAAGRWLDPAEAAALVNEGGLAEIVRFALHQPPTLTLPRALSDPVGLGVLNKPIIASEYLVKLMIYSGLPVSSRQTAQLRVPPRSMTPDFPSKTNRR